MGDVIGPLAVVNFIVSYPFLESMQQRPFNEHLLWKGSIQLANYPPPVQKPDMILPKINTLLGGTYPEDVWEQATQNYARYSRAYWQRVKRDHAIYRAERTGATISRSRWFY